MTSDSTLSQSNEHPIGIESHQLQARTQNTSNRAFKFAYNTEGQLDSGMNPRVCADALTPQSDINTFVSRLDYARNVYQPSDAHLRLVTVTDGEPPGPCFELPIHTTILAAASPYFKQRILDALSAASAQSSDNNNMNKPIIQEQVLMGEVETVSHLLYLVYQGRLPQSLPHLVKAANLAHRWKLMQSLDDICVQIGSVVTSQDLSIDDINFILSDAIAPVSAFSSPNSSFPSPWLSSVPHTCIEQWAWKNCKTLDEPQHSMLSSIKSAASATSAQNTCESEYHEKYTPKSILDSESTISSCDGDGDSDPACATSLLYDKLGAEKMKAHAVRAEGGNHESAGQVVETQPELRTCAGQQQVPQEPWEMPQNEHAHEKQAEHQRVLHGAVQSAGSTEHTEGTLICAREDHTVTEHQQHAVLSHINESGLARMHKKEDGVDDDAKPHVVEISQVMIQGHLHDQHAENTSNCLSSPDQYHLEEASSTESTTSDAKRIIQQPPSLLEEEETQSQLQKDATELPPVEIPGNATLLSAAASHVGPGREGGVTSDSAPSARRSLKAVNSHAVDGANRVPSSHQSEVDGDGLDSMGGSINLPVCPDFAMIMEGNASETEALPPSVFAHYAHHFSRVRAQQGKGSGGVSGPQPLGEGVEDTSHEDFTLNANFVTQSIEHSHVYPQASNASDQSSMPSMNSVATSVGGGVGVRPVTDKRSLVFRNLPTIPEGTCETTTIHCDDTSAAAALNASRCALGLSASVLSHPALQRLRGLAKDCLIELFGDAAYVAKSSSRLLQFLSLQFQSLVHWLEHSLLATDSENTICVLLCYWWNANAISQPASITMHWAATFSALIRVSVLSSCFLTGLLSEFPWFLADDKAVRTMQLARSLSMSSDLVYTIRDLVPNMWISGPRRISMHMVVMANSWEVSHADVAALHDRAARKAAHLESPGMYHSGFMWHLTLILNSQRDVLMLGVIAKSALPSLDMPPVLQATFSLGARRAGSAVVPVVQQAFKDALLRPGVACGTGTLLKVAATPGARRSSFPPAEYWSNGRLQLSFMLNKVD